MTCRQVQDALVDLHDGRLDGASELRVHAHLECCADCQKRAQTWNALLPAMRAVAPLPPTPLRLRRMEVEIERRLQEPVAPIAQHAEPNAQPGSRGRVLQERVALIAQHAEPKAQPGSRLRRARLAVAPALTPERRRPRWPLFALPAVAAAAALALWLVPRHRAPAPAVSPTVAATPAPPPAFAVVTSTRAPAGERLHAGSRVLVHAGDEAALQLSAQARLKLTGPASLSLGGDDAHVVLTLDDGRLEADVTHRQPGQTFAVAFPDGRVEVRGTRFVVLARPGASFVRVDEGRVAVFDRDGHQWSVGAGESHAFAVPPPATPPRAAAATPRAACEAPPVDCAHLTPSVRAAMRAADYARVQTLVEPALRTRPNCRPVACRTELGYLRAEALRSSGRLGNAVDAYKALDRPDAPSATRQNALYAAAQLERRLGQLDAARADFERAMRSAPTGALREEALIGLMETAEQAGDHAAAASAARLYLAAFPHGFGAADARRIANPDR
jgi:ferric-dicitrate binding protein FerR (iron transport regulator)